MVHGANQTSLPFLCWQVCHMQAYAPLLALACETAPHPEDHTSRYHITSAPSPTPTTCCSSFHPMADAPFELLALEAEVKLMASKQAAASPVIVDAEQLASQLARASFQHVLAVNQVKCCAHLRLMWFARAGVT